MSKMPHNNSTLRLRMKLLTQDITKNEVFRDRLRKLLSPKIRATNFKSKNPNSVDHVDRVSNINPQTVPRIGTISDSSPDEAQIKGSIKVELTLQTQIHGIDREETVSHTSEKECKFVVDVSGTPRTTSDLTATQIRALALKLREFSIK
jgi:hypothetical protein